MDASPLADRVRMVGTRVMNGGLAVDGIECQSGSSISNHSQTEAPKWIVRRMAWTLQRT